MGNSSTDALRFKGSPGNLSAALRLSGTVVRAHRVKVNLGGAAGSLAVRPATQAGSEVSLLRIKLPSTTPPGSYEGKIQIGGREMAVVAEVEPRARARFWPSRMTAQIRPGASVSEKTVLINLGNTSLEVERKYTFCIFDGSGVDRAFFTALGDENREGQTRMDLFMDQLADAHGGLVRVAVKRGAGSVAPGEARDLEVEFRFSGKLHAGRTYGGAWLLSNATYYVEVVVEGEKQKGEED